MYMLLRNRRSLILIGSILCFCDCSTSKTAQPSVSPKPEVKIPEQNHPSTGWLPRPTDAVVHYTIQDSSTITMNNDSSHASMIQTRIIYALELSINSDSVLITAKMESLTTTPKSPSGRGRTDTTSLRNFRTVSLAGGRMSTITQQTTSTCVGGIDPSGIRILDLAMTYSRRRLKVGDEWTDTVSTTTCRGKNTLTQQLIRRYRILELATPDHEDRVKIQRECVMSATTPSTEDKGRAAIVGSGTSTAIIFVNGASGLLLSADGNSESTFTVTTIRGSYPFAQRIVTHVEKQ